MARSVETALHKLAGAQFRPDPDRVGLRLGPSATGRGQRPGGDRPDQRRHPLRRAGHVCTCVGTTPASTQSGARSPRPRPHDHGEPFATIFAKYHNDFYAVDPHLFSPAEVVFQNLETGRVHVFGQAAPDVMVRSFYS